MAARKADCGFRPKTTAGQARLAAGFVVACGGLAVATAARADDMSAAAMAALTAHPLDASSQAPAALADNGMVLGAWNDSLSRATFFDEDFQSDAGEAPADELAAGLGVEVDQKRRKFRARIVDYMESRGAAFGRMTDFLLGGADSGWHFVVDPTGEDQYTLQWKAKFR